MPFYGPTLGGGGGGTGTGTGAAVGIKGSVATQANLPTTHAKGDAYITRDTGHLWIWDGTTWVDAGPIRGPKGDQGTQGIQGITGPRGLAGSKGDQGIQGLQGIQGVTGPIGPAGATGVSGAQGVAGPIGATGATGPAGTHGVDGTQGPIGPAGPTGASGPAGTMGAQGPKGLDGATGPTGQSGPQGAQGIQGIKGDPGIQGIAGNDGATGATGTQGPIGPIGATGADGIPGIAGPQGPVGPLGPQGEKGRGVQSAVINDTGRLVLTYSDGVTSDTGTAVGPAGPMGTLVAEFLGDWVTNHSYSKNQIVNYNGGTYFSRIDNNTTRPTDGVTTTEWGVLSLNGERGATGAQGPAGTPGSQGPAGPAGIPGSDGAKGATGSTGPTGPQGPQGVQGLKGDKGDKGDVGATGQTGPAGVAGAGTQVKGVWSASATYAIGDVVSYSGSIYQASAANGPSTAFPVSSYVRLDLGLPGTPPSASGQTILSTGTGLGQYTWGTITGTQGPQGPQGPTGPQGPAGPTGSTGPQGSTGGTGSAGATGPVGPAGPAGTGIPTGGRVGQVLRKNSATNGDAVWGAAAPTIVLYRTQSLTVAPGGNVNIPWTTIRYLSSASVFALSGPNIYVGVTGFYQVNLELTWDNGPNGTYGRKCAVYTGGTTPMSIPDWRGAVNSFQTSAASGIVYCEANNFIFAMAANAHPTAANTIMSADYSQFTIAYLGN